MICMWLLLLLFFLSYSFGFWCAGVAFVSVLFYAVRFYYYIAVKVHNLADILFIFVPFT